MYLIFICFLFHYLRDLGTQIPENSPCVEILLNVPVCQFSLIFLVYKRKQKNKTEKQVTHFTKCNYFISK